MRFPKLLEITLLLGILATYLAPAGESMASDPIELYPDVYTIDAARNLMASGEQLTSLWYCINLYHEHPDDVLELICSVREISNDLVLDVKAAFAANSPFDPAISVIREGTLCIDAGPLAQKGAWADSLCRDLESQLIEVHFVKDLVSFFSADYEEVTIPESGDNMLDQVQRVIGGLDFSDEIITTVLFLRAREGRSVQDYDLNLFSRVNIATLSTRSRVTCDSAWSSVLRTMGLRLPLPDPLPEAVKSPPTVLVKGTRSIVLVKFRCEDFVTIDGIRDYSTFWERAESIVGMIKGCLPSEVLGSGCGGPLRSLQKDIRTSR